MNNLNEFIRIYELKTEPVSSENINKIYRDNLNHTINLKLDDILEDYKKKNVSIISQIAGSNPDESDRNNTSITEYNNYDALYGGNNRQVSGTSDTLEELYLSSYLLSTNFFPRIEFLNKLSGDIDYFYNNMSGWKDTVNFEQITQSISSKDFTKIDHISYMYMSNGRIDIRANIRGCEIKLYEMKIRALPYYFYFLPPNIFNKIDVISSIDAIYVKHIVRRIDNDSNTIIYPSVYAYRNSKDITDTFDNEVATLNLLNI